MVQKRALKVKKVLTNGNNFTLNSREILDLGFFGSSKAQLLKYLLNHLDKKNKICWICTINPEFMMLAQKEPDFEKIIRSCDIRVIDGVGLLWAEKVLRKNNFFLRVVEGIKSGKKILKGERRQGLISGSDLIEDLVAIGQRKKCKFFFLGGWDDRAQRTAKKMLLKYPGIKVAWSPGEPTVDNKKVLSEIKKFSPDFLFVAYGMKRQEEWIYRNLRSLSAKVVVGVGRSFDYYSGELKRAPKAWRKMGLEWLYSLIQEPKRWRRQLALPKFIWRVLTTA